MKTNKITAKDIRELGAYGTLTALLPSYRHCRTVCNVVNYVRKSYPRADGLGYWTRINGTTITETDLSTCAIGSTTGTRGTFYLWNGVLQ